MLSLPLICDCCAVCVSFRRGFVIGWQVIPALVASTLCHTNAWLGVVWECFRIATNNGLAYAFPVILLSPLITLFNQHSMSLCLHLMGFRIFHSRDVAFLCAFLSFGTFWLPLCVNKTKCVCTNNLMFSMLLLHPAASSSASFARCGMAGHVWHAAYARVVANTPSGVSTFCVLSSVCYLSHPRTRHFATLAARELQI